MSKIKLSGYIDVPPEDLPAVLQELPTHIALTRKEPGCLYFSVEEDVHITGRFYVDEIFKDEKSFSDHQRRVQASDWGRVTARAARHYKKEVIRYDSAMQHRQGL